MRGTFSVFVGRGRNGSDVIKGGFLLPCPPTDALPVEEVQPGQKEWEIGVGVRASIRPYLKKEARTQALEGAGRGGGRWEWEISELKYVIPVSYTHLTLPTIYSV